MNIWRQRGVLAALGAALLFGAGTPAAKLLLGPASPWLLAGLLYLGSGIGLALFRIIRPSDPVLLQRSEIKWLVGAIVAGGMNLTRKVSLGDATFIAMIKGLAAGATNLALALDSQYHDAEAFRDFDKLLAIAKRPNVAAKASALPCYTSDS